MEEHVGDLAILEKRYAELVETLETQLQEARRKLTIVSNAIELLKKEGIFDQQKLIQVPTVLSERYKNMSMTKAVIDILKTKTLSARDIYSELLKHGFESKSKKLLGDLQSSLSRLKGKGVIISKKQGNAYKYSLPKSKEVIIEEKIPE